MASKQRLQGRNRKNGLFYCGFGVKYFHLRIRIGLQVEGGLRIKLILYEYLLLTDGMRVGWVLGRRSWQAVEVLFLF